MHDEADRQRYLETLGEVCQPTAWRVHAFVLMGNHYHLLIETPQPLVRKTRPRSDAACILELYALSCRQGAGARSTTRRLGVKLQSVL